MSRDIARCHITSSDFNMRLISHIEADLLFFHHSLIKLLITPSFTAKL